MTAIQLLLLFIAIGVAGYLIADKLQERTRLSMYRDALQLNAEIKGISKRDAISEVISKKLTKFYLSYAGKVDQHQLNFLYGMLTDHIILRHRLGALLDSAYEITETSIEPVKANLNCSKANGIVSILPPYSSEAIYIHQSLKDLAGYR